MEKAIHVNMPEEGMEILKVFTASSQFSRIGLILKKDTGEVNEDDEKIYSYSAYYLNEESGNLIQIREIEHYDEYYSDILVYFFDKNQD